MEPNHRAIDEIGPWSEDKLDVIEAYIKFYMKIMKAPRQAEWARTMYVDAFAGAGFSVSREHGDQVLGSTMRALATEPCFDEYMFIEQDRRKVELLRSHCERYWHLPVDVRHGDCNEILLKTVFPRIRQDRRLRAVLLMDPYGLQYDWSVVVEAGATKRVDLILNFPMMGAQRAAFWRRPDDLPASLRRRMRRAWGDDSWLRTVYEEVPNLLAKDPDFGPELVKKPCREIAEVCRKRIREKATFKYVAAPHHSRNGHGTVIFFLFLASQIRVAEKVMDYIVKTKGKQSWRSQP